MGESKSGKEGRLCGWARLLFAAILVVLKLVVIGGVLQRGREMMHV
jgi:hypothetical protein